MAAAAATAALRGAVFEDQNSLNGASFARTSTGLQDYLDLRRAALEQLYGPQLAEKKVRQRITAHCAAFCPCCLLCTAAIRLRGSALARPGTGELARQQGLPLLSWTKQSSLYLLCKSIHDRVVKRDLLHNRRARPSGTA
jgi:hypothetical protein